MGLLLYIARLTAELLDISKRASNSIYRVISRVASCGDTHDDFALGQRNIPIATQLSVVSPRFI